MKLGVVLLISLAGNTWALLAEPDGYSCAGNNPCTKENIDAKNLYFPHKISGKFVQCDAWGGCFDMDCPAGLVWDVDETTCNYPKDDPPCDPSCEKAETYNCGDNNPCTKENIDDEKFYWAHDMATKFVQCDQWGQCFEMPCGPGTEWDQKALTCGWPKDSPSCVPCPDGEGSDEASDDDSDESEEDDTGSGYTCGDSSPCTKENIEAGNFHFPHTIASKFVQCDEHGGCFEMDCPKGLVWDSDAVTCNYPNHGGSDGSDEASDETGGGSDEASDDDSDESEEASDDESDESEDISESSDESEDTSESSDDDSDGSDSGEDEVTVGSCTFFRVREKEEGLATYCSRAQRSDMNSLVNCLTEACDSGRNAVNMHLGKSCYIRECATPITDENLLLDVTVTKHVGRDIWVKRIDYCHDSACVNGDCENTERSFQCHCHPGYVGKLCDTDIDECLDSPCPEDSICTNSPGSFTCTMPDPEPGNCDIDSADRIPCESGSEEECAERGCCWQEGSCFHGDNTVKTVGSCTWIRVRKVEDGVANFCGRAKGSDVTSLENCLQEACDTNRNAVNEHPGEVCRIRECNTPLIDDNLLLGSTEEYEHHGRNIWVKRMDYCQDNPCVNGECENLERSFQCHCQPGYAGPLCDTDIDECLDSPCPENNICTNTPGSFTCTVPEPEPGNCDVDSADRIPCESSSEEECAERGCCWQEGNCFHGDNTVKTVGSCTWIRVRKVEDGLANFCGRAKGSDVTSLENCLQEACDTNRNAVNEHPGKVCMIRECSTPLIDDNLLLGGTEEYKHHGRNIWVKRMDYCLDNPCVNGECENLERSFQCHCHPGYAGPLCDTDIDECQDNPCPEGSSCENTPGSFTCIEPEPEPDNCDVDSADRIPCDSTSQEQCDERGCCWQDGSCFHGDNTVETVGSCTWIQVRKVEDGLTSYCDRPQPSDPKSFSNCLQEACDTGRNTVNRHPGNRCYIRECETPLIDDNLRLGDTDHLKFKGRDVWVKYIDYCNENPCLNGGVCVASERDFTCQCAHGYGGHLCGEDIDECSDDPCAAGEECTNTPGSYTCTPKPDDGYTCEDPNPCTPENAADGKFHFPHKDSSKFVQCSEWGQCYVMDCPSGLVWDVDAVTCNYPGEKPTCDPKCKKVERFNCRDNIPCTKENIKAEKFYWSHDVSTKFVQCDAFGRCFEMPCGPGTEWDQEAYTCNWPKDPCVPCPGCSSNPCLNGGVCNPGSGSDYTCDCPSGYTGEYCQDKIPPCASHPCQNGGSCTDGTADDYHCQCADGYTGQNCQDIIPGCSSDPCQNGGTCNNGENGDYTCVCDDGYTGDDCQTKLPPCYSHPCQNGGSCTDGTGDDYTCDCVFGYTGENCQDKIPPCDWSPCQNGGTCENTDSGYTCDCTNSYTGTNCETKLPSTCAEAFLSGSTETGVKVLAYNDKQFNVFCEYEPETGLGYATFSTAAITDNATFTLNLQDQYSDRSHARLRVFMKDGSQKVFKLSQMEKYKDRSLTYMVNTFDGFNGPRNTENYSPYYLYLGFLDKPTVNMKSLQGIKLDDVDLSFTNCDKNPNSYIATYPTLAYNGKPYGLKSKYRLGNDMRKLMNKKEATVGASLIPDADVKDYKFTMEIHLGGCGIIELSSDWADRGTNPLNADAAALSFPFALAPKIEF